MNGLSWRNTHHANRRPVYPRRKHGTTYHLTLTHFWGHMVHFGMESMRLPEGARCAARLHTPTCQPPHAQQQPNPLVCRLQPRPAPLRAQRGA
jgi:hypothetical protein